MKLVWVLFLTQYFENPWGSAIRSTTDARLCKLFLSLSLVSISFIWCSLIFVFRRKIKENLPFAFPMQTWSSRIYNIPSSHLFSALSKQSFLLWKVFQTSDHLSFLRIPRSGTIFVLDYLKWDKTAEEWNLLSGQWQIWGGTQKGLVPISGSWSQSSTAQSTFFPCPGVLGRWVLLRWKVFHSCNPQALRD